MAQVRTRKQKVAQSIKREQQLSYSLPATMSSTSQTKAVVKGRGVTASDQEKMFGYSVELIKKDIIKTVVIAVIILALLGAIVVFEK